MCGSDWRGCHRLTPGCKPLRIQKWFSGWEARLALQGRELFTLLLLLQNKHRTEGRPACFRPACLCPAETGAAVVSHHHHQVTATSELRTRLGGHSMHQLSRSRLGKKHKGLQWDINSPSHNKKNHALLQPSRTLSRKPHFITHFSWIILLCDSPFCFSSMRQETAHRWWLCPKTSHVAMTQK